MKIQSLAYNDDYDDPKKSKKPGAVRPAPSPLGLSVGGGGSTSGGSGSSGITVGTTTITSGSSTKVLYNNAGVVGEYSITGTGNVVMSDAPTLTGNISAQRITLTVANAAAFTVGPNGAANPTFNVATDTASQETGIGIIGAAAGSGVTIRVTSSGSNENLILTPKGTGVLEQRNGANAQTFNIYNTYTSPTVYAGIEHTFVGNVYYIRSRAAGGGSAQTIAIDGASLFFTTGGTNRWNVNSSGHFLAATDNTYDIGASGATRPRYVYVGTGFDVQGNIIYGDGGNLYLRPVSNQLELQGPSGSAGTSLNLIWKSSSKLSAPADGQFLLRNNAGTDFDRLQFGGTSASFPSLQRSGTSLKVRLADNSDDAPLTTLTVKTKALTVATLPSAATAGAGARAFVTDSNSSTFAGVVAGGGAISVPVFSDGANWYIG